MVLEYINAQEKAFSGEEGLAKRSGVWIPETGTFLVQAKGEMNLDGLCEWEEEVRSAIRKIKDNSRFKAIIDMSHFHPVDLDTFRAMRPIIPLLLANYHFRVGYPDSVENLILPLRKIRGIQCVAIAHVSHDTYKMFEFNRKFATDHERFFTSRQEAEQWLEQISMD
ncbi:hypothetical protein ACX0G9_03035 [Flavitalea flava]